MDEAFTAYMAFIPEEVVLFIQECEFMKTNHKAIFIIILMNGVLMMLLGLMECIRSIEITDVILIISGLVMIGASLLYRIIIPY